LPALGAIGSRAALEQSRARGELAALEALGGSPLRVAFGASVAGWTIGALGLLLIVSPGADPSSLFPVATRADPWLPAGAELWNAAAGVRIDAQGGLRLAAAPPRQHSISTPDGLVALVATAPVAVVLPLWISARLGLVSRVAGALGVLALMISLFHALAASRTSAGWLSLAALPMAAQALVAHRRCS
jgi:hypothetical protein